MKSIRKLEFILLLITYFSVSTFLNFYLSIEVIQWIVYGFFIYYLLVASRNLQVNGEQERTKTFNWILIFYTTFVFLSFLRGIFFYAGDYWTYKASFTNLMALSIPFFTYVYANPIFLSRVLGTWFKWAPLLILLLFFAGFRLVNFQWAIGPFFMIGIFFSLMAQKWKFIFLLAFLLCFFEFDARSQLIKGIITALIAFFIYIDHYFSLRRLKFIYFGLVFIPIFLLILGITGIFNVFELDAYIDSADIAGFQKEDENLLADTRTGLYSEVISSAVNNDYILFGRSLARGNDSELFGLELNSLVTQNGLAERSSNEMALPTIFTWTGIVGLFLYTFLFLSSGYYAIFRSKNRYVPYMGIYILIYWAYSWVENPVDFNLSNICIWFSIGMCVSFQFRMMTDLQFKGWLNSIFSGRRLNFFHTQ